MNVESTPEFDENFKYWIKYNKKIAEKIQNLIEAVKNDPFIGIGKPESLKHNLSKCWSRRINKEHRIVYTVENDTILFISCRYHYNKT